MVVAHRRARREGGDAGKRRSRPAVVGGAIGATRRRRRRRRAARRATRGRARGARAARARARERQRDAAPGGDGRARVGVGGAGGTHADGSPARRRAMPRALRERFVRRVVVASVAPNPQLLALAGGWLVRAMRDDANGEGEGEGDGVDVARGVWWAATESARDAGWAKPSEGGKHAFQGWYAEAGAGVAAGASAARERIELCLLAFHGLPRDARAAAAAEAMAAFAGEGDGERRPRAGAVAKAARAHAALIAAHCARHFARCPTWLKTRAKRIVRGEVLSHAASAATDRDDFELTEFGSLRGRRGGADRKPATPPALAALLFHLDDGDASEEEEEGERDGVEDATAPSSLARAAAASVRAAAVALADASGNAASASSSPALSPTAMSRSNSALSLELSGEASGAGTGPGASTSPRTSHAVDAYARRAAWSLLAALPRSTPTETFATTDRVVGGAGTLAFVWRAAESSRGGVSRPVVDAVVAALREETTPAESVAGEDAACRAAMTCAAADALSRAASASASSKSSSSSSSSSRESSEASGEPAWATLATLAEALAAATRRWTERALAARLAPGEARAASLMLAAGLPHAKYAPALGRSGRVWRRTSPTSFAATDRGPFDARRRSENLTTPRPSPRRSRRIFASRVTATPPRVVRVPAGARSRARRRESRRASGRVGERTRRRRRCRDGAPRRHRRSPVDGVRVAGGVEGGGETPRRGSRFRTTLGRRRGGFGGKGTVRRRTRRGDGDTSRRGRLRGCRRRVRVGGDVRERGERQRRRGASRRRRRAPLSRRTGFIVVGEISLVETLRRLARTNPRPRARRRISRGGTRGTDGPRDETELERRGRGRGRGRRRRRRRAFDEPSRTRVLGGLDASRLVSDDATAESSAAALMDFAGPFGRRQRHRRGSASRADRGERGVVVGGVARAGDASRGDASTDTRGMPRSRTVRVVAMRAKSASTRAHARETGARAAAEAFAELVDAAAALAASEPRRSRRFARNFEPSRRLSRRRRPAAETRDGPFPPLRTRRRGRSLGVHPAAFAHARVRDGRVDVIVVAASADRRLESIRNAASRRAAALGDVAADPLGSAALQAAEAGLGLLQSNVSPGARARLLSSSLFGDLDLALGIGADDAPRAGTRSETRRRRRGRVSASGSASTTTARISTTTGISRRSRRRRRRERRRRE